MYITDVFPFLKEPTLLCMLVRAMLAFAVSGLIGYERNTHGAPAGMRTHMLVCLGAMIAMSTGQYAAIMYSGADITRIGAQVVSGVSFWVQVPSSSQDRTK